MTAGAPAAAAIMFSCVVAAIGATRFPDPVRRTAVTTAACGAGIGALWWVGADLSALAAVAPLTLVLGYAAVASVLTRGGVTDALAARLGAGPLGVLALAATASVVLSNDIVIVAFAPIVLARRTVVVDAAALYVGANITGGLLPQGSPTNLIVFGDDSFGEYLQRSAPITAAMFATAFAAFALLTVSSRRGRADRRAPARPLDTRQRRLAAFGLVAIAAQPVAGAVGFGRVELGAALFVASGIVAAVLANRDRTPTAAALRNVALDVPWQVIALAGALIAGATVLTQSGPIDAGGVDWVLRTFATTALSTDITAAAVAAPTVAAHPELGAATLIGVTAGAFATPIASISGVLLLNEYRVAGTTPTARTFATAGCIAVACMIAGTAAASV